MGQSLTPGPNLGHLEFGPLHITQGKGNVFPLPRVLPQPVPGLNGISACLFQLGVWIALSNVNEIKDLHQIILVVSLKSFQCVHRSESFT